MHKYKRFSKEGVGIGIRYIGTAKGNVFRIKSDCVM